MSESYENGWKAAHDHLSRIGAVNAADGDKCEC